MFFKDEAKETLNEYRRGKTSLGNAMKKLENLFESESQNAYEDGYADGYDDGRLNPDEDTVAEVCADWYAGRSGY